MVTWQGRDPWNDDSTTVFLCTSDIVIGETQSEIKQIYEKGLPTTRVNHSGWPMVFVACVADGNWV